ncbi:hypothetical protein BKA81DRAFT_408830 [Phyllosticta paracitricarpa]
MSFEIAHEAIMRLRTLLTLKRRRITLLQANLTDCSHQIAMLNDKVAELKAALETKAAALETHRRNASEKDDKAQQRWDDMYRAWDEMKNRQFQYTEVISWLIDHGAHTATDESLPTWLKERLDAWGITIDLVETSQY